MSVTDFIKSAISDKPNQAQKAFDAAIRTKVDAALAQKESEVSKTLFNSQTQETD